MLADGGAFAASLAPFRNSGWVVIVPQARLRHDAKPPFGGPEAVLACLGRDTHRVAIPNSRPVGADAGAVAFRWKDHRIKRGDRPIPHVLPAHGAPHRRQRDRPRRPFPRSPCPETAHPEAHHGHDPEPRPTPATTLCALSPWTPPSPPRLPPWEVFQRGPRSRQAEAARRSPRRKTFTRAAGGRRVWQSEAAIPAGCGEAPAPRAFLWRPSAARDLSISVAGGKGLCRNGSRSAARPFPS